MESAIQEGRRRGNKRDSIMRPSRVRKPRRNAAWRSLGGRSAHAQKATAGPRWVGHCSLSQSSSSSSRSAALLLIDCRLRACGRLFEYGVARGSSVRTGSMSVASDLCRAALVINVTFDFCNVGAAAAFGGSFANQSCLWGSAAAAKAYPNSNVVAIFDEDVVTWHASAAHHHRGGGSLGYS